MELTNLILETIDLYSTSSNNMLNISADVMFMSAGNSNKNLDLFYVRILNV